MNNKIICVLGASGLIGNAFVRYYNKSSIKILKPTHSELDLSNQNSVKKYFKKHKPNKVILSAGMVGGIKANSTFPSDFIYTNSMINANVIHESWINGVSELLYFGSTCMYPLNCNQPMEEKDLLSGHLEPTSEPYALSKIVGWKMCETYNKQYSTSFRVVIPTNLYGPNDNFKLEDGHVIPALINKIHNAKINNTNNVVIWGSGNSKREFLHVNDLVDACTHLDQYNDILGPINIGSNEEVTIRDLAKDICKIIEYEGKLVFKQDMPDGMPLKKVNSSYINNLRWNSKISLKEGLQKTYDWYIKQINSPLSKRNIRI